MQKDLNHKGWDCEVLKLEFPGKGAGYKAQVVDNHPKLWLYKSFVRYESVYKQVID